MRGERLDRRRSRCFSRLFPAAWFKRKSDAHILGHLCRSFLGWLAVRPDAIRGGSPVTFPVCACLFFPQAHQPPRDEDELATCLQVVFSESSQLEIALSSKSETGPAGQDFQKERLLKLSSLRLQLPALTARALLSPLETEPRWILQGQNQKSGRDTAMGCLRSQKEKQRSSSPTNSQSSRFRSLAMVISLTTLMLSMTTFFASSPVLIGWIENLHPSPTSPPSPASRTMAVIGQTLILIHPFLFLPIQSKVIPDALVSPLSPLYAPAVALALALICSTTSGYVSYVLVPSS